MRSTRFARLFLGIVLFASLAPGCFIFEKDDEDLFPVEHLVFLMLVQMQGPVAPYVRFTNNSGATEKYILFSDSACAKEPVRVFPSTATGTTTATHPILAFYLNVNGTLCTSTQFKFGYMGSGYQPVTLTCTVTATQVSCDDPGGTVVNR